MHWINMFIRGLVEFLMFLHIKGWIVYVESNNIIYTDSEWLLFNDKSAIFQLYHGENKLIFNEMMMNDLLY